jgi:glucose-1-phosphate thymidylyltransferase
MNNTKGIILAGGLGTRLYPLTQIISKQLLPVFDKPMIYYPLSVLMLAGIRDILIISTQQDLAQFKHLLGNGEKFGISLQYEEQSKPNGLPEAFIIGENFIQSSSCLLILGDNVFYGNELPKKLQQIKSTQEGAIIFPYLVQNPEQYGVVTFDSQGQVIDLEEKPKKPKSRYAVTGLYFFDNQVVHFAKQLRPSIRGELEIIDLIKCYLKTEQLKAQLLGRGIAWLDTGTHESLLEASQFIHTIEKRQGLKIACLEEIAYRMGYITAEQVELLAISLNKNGYGHYLLNLLNEQSGKLESLKTSDSTAVII